jgi:hypothetical protein
MGISRRAALGGIGHTAALGAMAAALSTPLRAAQPAAAPAPAAPPTTYCLSMIFRPAEGASFNADLFRDSHLPLLKRVYGNSIDRVELRVPMPVAEGAPGPQIIGTVNVWFRDVIEFSKRNTAGMQEITASMATVTAAPMIGQVDQVLSALGDDRLTVPVDSLCFSTFFPAKEGATIDARYFAETFFPKLAELYGTTAIRRIEVTSGAAGAAGGKPVVLNSAHIYIRDEAAYDAAAAKSGAELGAEMVKFTNIQPLSTLTRLHAVG